MTIGEIHWVGVRHSKQLERGACFGYEYHLIEYD